MRYCMIFIYWPVVVLVPESVLVFLFETKSEQAEGLCVYSLLMYIVSNFSLHISWMNQSSHEVFGRFAWISRTSRLFDLIACCIRAQRNLVSKKQTNTWDIRTLWTLTHALLRQLSIDLLHSHYPRPSSTEHGTNTPAITSTSFNISNRVVPILFLSTYSIIFT